MKEPLFCQEEWEKELQCERGEGRILKALSIHGHGRKKYWLFFTPPPLDFIIPSHSLLSVPVLNSPFSNTFSVRTFLPKRTQRGFSSCAEAEGAFEGSWRGSFFLAQRDRYVHQYSESIRERRVWEGWSTGRDETNTVDVPGAAENVADWLFLLLGRGLKGISSSKRTSFAKTFKTVQFDNLFVKEKIFFYYFSSKFFFFIEFQTFLETL